VGIRDSSKKLEDLVKELPLIPKKSKTLRDENKRLKKLFSKYLNPRKKAKGGDVKIKPKPTNPNTMAVKIKPKPTNPDTLARIQSANRINIMERGQELVAQGKVTQKQLDESLRIFDKTKSMETVNQYMKAEESKRNRARIKVKPAEKSRIKVKPMGKRSGGMMNSRAIAKKYFKGGMA